MLFFQNFSLHHQYFLLDCILSHALYSSFYYISYFLNIYLLTFRYFLTKFEFEQNVWQGLNQTPCVMFERIFVLLAQIWTLINMNINRSEGDNTNRNEISNRRSTNAFRNRITFLLPWWKVRRNVSVSNSLITSSDRKQLKRMKDNVGARGVYVCVGIERAIFTRDTICFRVWQLVSSLSGSVDERTVSIKIDHRSFFSLQINIAKKKKTEEKRNGGTLLKDNL